MTMTGWNETKEQARARWEAKQATKETDRIVKAKTKEIKALQILDALPSTKREAVTLWTIALLTPLIISLALTVLSAILW